MLFLTSIWKYNKEYKVINNNVELLSIISVESCFFYFFV